MTIGLLQTRTVAVGVAIGTNPVRPPRAAGEAVAALLAAMVGMLTLAAVNLATELSAGFSAWVFGIGKLWMPGAAGLGPYSGKETLSLVAWIVSWIVLHRALRGRALSLSRWLLVFLAGVAIATTLIWPPVYGYFAH